MSRNLEGTDLIFWDVDTQFDFMTPPEQGGLLYVRDAGDPRDPGATAIVPLLERLSAYARDHDILRVATGDWHTLDHREIGTESPNFRTTFPPHCMAGEQGSLKIPETELRRPLVLGLRSDRGHAWDVARRAVREHRDIFIQKEEFSCFTGNRATEALLEALNPRAIVVYGVPLDVGVRHAVEGMLDREWQVYVVEDATRGLGIERPDELLARWEERGAVRVTSAEVLAGAVPRVKEEDREA
jgi:nicotinamidase/pyrazinamidase